MQGQTHAKQCLLLQIVPWNTKGQPTGECSSAIPSRITGSCPGTMDMPLESSLLNWLLPTRFSSVFKLGASNLDSSEGMSHFFVSNHQRSVCESRHSSDLFQANALKVTKISLSY